MSVAKSTGVCPYCKEPINAAATKCKHCQSDLSDVRKKRQSLFSRYNTFKVGFTTGAAFAVLLVILIYLQFFSE
jgi:predicted amidophosphoribosyltransferase